ncbi:MAG: hypothetical protein IT328_20615 [Caldilineaceae bacterium]|nr:hypothetical protein [Caldilineaceae bacterium]
MQSRQAFILLVTLFLIMVLLAGYNQLLPRKQTNLPVAQLENVRDHIPALTPGGPEYVVDGGRLYVGHPGYWVEIPLPEEVIASAVDVRIAPAVDAGLAHEVIYIGAANQLAVYRTEDRGENWLHGKLTHDLVHKGLVGGVTDLAVDPVQRIIYVGTDTAGLFRVRDGEETMKSSAQLLLDDPVVQIVTDRQGSGVTYLRTEWTLYQGFDYGLQWSAVDTLRSVPTAMTLASTNPPALLVGTADRGVLRSEDGITWTELNGGLTATPALSLRVNALAIDPLQPAMAYVAVSYLTGTHFARHSADLLAYTRDGGESWLPFEQPELSARVTDLLPVSGYTAAAYLLTSNSRTPQAIGNAPAGSVPALVEKTQPATSSGAGLAWIAAGLAALALAFALVTDVLTRPEIPLTGPNGLEPRPARRNRWS